MKPLAELERDLIAGRTTSVELTNAAIARIDDPDGEGPRAFLRVFHEAALAEAEASDRLRDAGVVRSPIDGIPVSVKDLCDVAGYKILPHQDIPEELITTQFYLPRDRGRAYLGTWLYEQGANDPDEYRKVKQIEFFSNSGYSFKVSETSWHGVEETHAAESPRDTLMIIYCDPNKLPQKEH